MKQLSNLIVIMLAVEVRGRLLWLRWTALGCAGVLHAGSGRFKAIQPANKATLHNNNQPQALGVQTLIIAFQFIITKAADAQHMKRYSVFLALPSATVRAMATRQRAVSGGCVLQRTWWYWDSCCLLFVLELE